MKTCDIVQDLLPLYTDNICSDESRRFVEEHISECKTCADVLSRLTDTDIEKKISLEKNDVLKHSYLKSKRRSFAAGIITAAVLMIPVVVCLIVNLASGHTLDWFFIVLSALLVTASLTVVPLVAAEKKLLLTASSFLVTLMLLLAVCCIYTHGVWFFIAAISILMGAATTILPILVHIYSPDNFIKRNKALLVYISDTVLLLLLFISIAVYIKDAGFIIVALMISAEPVLFMWLILAAARYLPFNRIIRAGSVTLILGIMTAVTNPVINSIIDNTSISIFSEDNHINLIIGIVMAAAATVIIVTGIAYGITVKARNKKKDKIKS